MKTIIYEFPFSETEKQEILNHKVKETPFNKELMVLDFFDNPNLLKSNISKVGVALKITNELKLKHEYTSFNEGIFYHEKIIITFNSKKQHTDFFKKYYTNYFLKSQVSPKKYIIKQ